jgi:hypothetical protein
VETNENCEKRSLKDQTGLMVVPMERLIARRVAAAKADVLVFHFPSHIARSLESTNLDQAS